MMRNPGRISKSIGFVLASLVLSVSVFAQENLPEKTEQKPDENVIIMRGPGAEREVLPGIPPDVFLEATPGVPIGGNTFTFVSSEMSFDGKVVKGAPYSARAVTEVTQTLADGNRIVRKSTASVYRDSEGRTRRDQMLGSIGPFAAAGDPPQTFFINDPVAGFNYVLDPRTHTARKLPLPRIERISGDKHEFNIERKVIQAGPEGGPAAGVAGPGSRVMVFEKREEGLGPLRTSKEGPKPKKESLGKQTIEGVEAEGTRITLTIPAGKIGNERPIEIVTERWYSPELQTVVLSRNNDPFMGESVYRLTNISRNEPARSLFEIPADYKIKDVPMPPGIRIMRSPANNK
ncbi:MAG TPA: hypothetical protein VM911_23410 [Pyrinomonadaceae bacterium]|nr:hypothetical protein [Pyrinomonadaceae bacterium]